MKYCTPHKRAASPHLNKRQGATVLYVVLSVILTYLAMSNPSSNYCNLAEKFVNKKRTLRTMKQKEGKSSKKEGRHFQNGQVKVAAQSHQ